MSWIDELRVRVEGQSVEYEAERLLLKFTDQIVTQMEALEINRADLARIMGVNRARVTRVLRGDHNLTTRTLIEAALAVGCRLSLELTPLTTSEATVFTAPPRRGQYPRLVESDMIRMTFSQDDQYGEAAAS